MDITGVNGSDFGGIAGVLAGVATYNVVGISFGV